MNKLSWEQYFMAMVQITSLRSKDPNTKVGAILINKHKRVIGTGYNGMPLGNDTFPWKREAKEAKDTKYPYVIHAEMNAILNAKDNTNDSSIFVTLFPCSNCSKLIVQAGVKHIYYMGEKYKDTPDDKISKIILRKSRISTKKIDTINVSVTKK